ncbi:hypothetical protein [Commensalibacter nepenthis]|uniref:Uncharacterized protein n=1 Tax=Commensalibacter nepenthis TaxID=3043872 RepID=A0ABT6Q8F6_9PROT|nr:hypothetical protein [Commensalibacter sp. TBRC 10068]MDI2113188.1 hypothetical protein [Commensalibacter sp. TBRC 10068]
MNHYGKVLTIGDKADSEAMMSKLVDWNNSSLKNVVDILKVIPDFFKFHLPRTQAADMGIELSPHSLLCNMISTQHGNVIPMVNDSITVAFKT